MAKELPYFKFEPNQWDNGNIQMCSREDKGLFIDLCSIYWSRLGDVPLKLAVQKLCGGNATAFDSLITSHIFRVIDGMIYIEFLDEQLQEFELLSNQNKENALKGWEKRRQTKASSDRNATASIPQSENDAIREDKKIIDKRTKEEKLLARKKIFASTLEPFVSVYGKDLVNEFYKYWTEPNKSGTKFKQELQATWSLERRLETWAKNDKTFKPNTNGTTATSKAPTMGQRMDDAFRRAEERRMQQSGGISSNQSDELTSFEDVT